MRRKLWLIFLTLVYTAAVGCVLVATVSQGWFEVSCVGPENHRLHLGLWGACSDSIQNSSNPETNFCGQIQRVLNHGHIPGWLRGTQLLSFANVTGSAIVFVLLLGYCMVPEPVALAASGGFSAAALATSAFCMTTVLNASTAIHDLQNWVSKDFCEVINVEFSTSFYLTVSAFLLAIVPSLTGLIVHCSYPAESIERLKRQTSGVEGSSSAIASSQDKPHQAGLQTKMFGMMD